ncbi:hypothetical protein, conserved [Plasmodium gonderi]|uniref:Cyclin-dependent kinases regulatory subunit n=1 Tax=Plasmodium gonderi TaxID=77519 RepID=A0A1Y1JBR6_PLAGO|nr:hypothetical protein, conserved [Plasmodium gonderi]GAW79118.1 hypothetical protein, conserved [Plasmodium gonderi]
MSFERISHNMNLSIHKIINARYSAPSKGNDECKPVFKKRRCTIAHGSENNTYQRNHIDYLNYNFNNAFTKRRKYSSPYALSYKHKKFTPLKSRTQLRNSVDETIKKSVALRSIVNKTIKKKRSEIYEHDEKNYLNMHKTYYLNKPQGTDTLDELVEANQLHNQHQNLNETYIMSNTMQSENYNGDGKKKESSCLKKNEEGKNAFRDTLPLYVNSESTISSFNLERELDNKMYTAGIAQAGNTASGALRTHLESDMLKNTYMHKSNSSTIDEETTHHDHHQHHALYYKDHHGPRYYDPSSIHHTGKNDYESKKEISSHPLKRRHSTQFSKEYEKHNYSDSYFFNKKFKEEDKNQKGSTRRHSDAIRCKPLNGPYYSSVVTNKLNAYSHKNQSLLCDYNTPGLEESHNTDMNESLSEKDSVNPLFHTCFLKNSEEFENGDIKRKDKIEPLNPEEEDDSVLKNDAEYLFSKGFFKDIYSNIQRKGELNFIDELLEADDEYYISKSKLNKIIENAKNKEMKYHYIDRMFLYRHAKNVIDDADYETYKSKCRAQYKYLDVPYPNLAEIMNLKSVGVFDEIDDTDEFYHAEVKLLERYYYKSSKQQEAEGLQNHDREQMQHPQQQKEKKKNKTNKEKEESNITKKRKEEIDEGEIDEKEKGIEEIDEKKNRMDKGGKSIVEERKQKDETINGIEECGEEKQKQDKRNSDDIPTDNEMRIENRLILSKRNIPFNERNFNEYLSDSEKRDKLIFLMNKIKREKESFFEQILDAPDFSKILEPVFSLNESFLLSHQLFNVQYAAQLGPVVYLIKTEDENYVYRAIEVSRLFEEKVKSILDNQKANANSKDRNDCYDEFSNEKFPFLHELDVKYYLRIPMSTGWNHFGYLKNQNNVLFFRRRKNT